MSDILKKLRQKCILGEYGAFTRPYVILDVDEYHAVLAALEDKPKRGRPRKADIPHETVR